MSEAGADGAGLPAKPQGGAGGGGRVLRRSVASTFSGTISVTGATAVGGSGTSNGSAGSSTTEQLSLGGGMFWS